MIDLGPYQFSDSGHRVVKRALEESQHRPHNFIGPEDIMTRVKTREENEAEGCER